MNKAATIIVLYAAGSVCIFIGMLSRLERVNVNDRIFLLIGIVASLVAFALLIQLLLKRKSTGNQKN